MNPRLYSFAVCVNVLLLAAATTACAQDTTSTRPGVHLVLTYPRGSIPRVIVLPIDTTAGDSARTIIQRDLDYSDRVSPIPLDASTLMGLVPAAGQEPNYALFSQLGAAAIVQGTRTANGLRMALYDVGAKKKIEQRDLPVILVPPVRDVAIRDSILTETTLREKALRDSVS